MRGLRTKLCELHAEISVASEWYDVIILVETWLCDGIADSELGLEDFNVYRVDRSSDNSKYLRGGGVLIAVRKNLFSKRLKTLVVCVEHLFVDIRLEHKNIIIGTVYLPPLSDPCIYDSHCRSIEEAKNMSPGAEILIVGDYNLPHIVWHNFDDVLQYKINNFSNMTVQADIILGYFNEFDCFQYNGISNVNHDTLDLVFSSLRNVTVTLATEPLCICD